MERRTEIISIRFTEKELEHLKKCSGSFKKAKFQNGRDNFSEYLREKLLKESDYRNKVLEQQLADLRYEIRKIGTNINQVTKKINSGFGTSNDLKEIVLCMEETQQIFEKFREEVEHAWQSQS